MLYGNLPTREINKCQSLYKQGALLQLPKGCGSEAGCHIHVLVQGKSKYLSPWFDKIQQKVGEDALFCHLRPQDSLRLPSQGINTLSAYSAGRVLWAFYPSTRPHDYHIYLDDFLHFLHFCHNTLLFLSLFLYWPVIPVRRHFRSEILKYVWYFIRLFVPLHPLWYSK